MPSTRNVAVHWTSNLWTCLYCGVAPGQAHQVGCAARNTTAQVIWMGPPITPGMVPREVVAGDICGYLTCMHCELPFEPGDTIFENRSQSLGIHGNCILYLAKMIPRELPDPDEIEAEFERRRAELLDERP